MASLRIAAGKTGPEQVCHRSEVPRKMAEQLTSEKSRTLNARQAYTIEPHFSNSRHTKRFTRFSRRGQRVYQAEWTLHHRAKNPRKWAGGPPPRPRTAPAVPPLARQATRCRGTSSVRPATSFVAGRTFCSRGRQPVRHLTGTWPHR